MDAVRCFSAAHHDALNGGAGADGDEGKTVRGRKSGAFLVKNYAQSELLFVTGEGIFLESEAEGIGLGCFWGLSGDAGLHVAEGFRFADGFFPFDSPYAIGIAGNDAEALLVGSGFKNSKGITRAGGLDFLGLRGVWLALEFAQNFAIEMSLRNGLRAIGADIPKCPLGAKGHASGGDREGLECLQIFGNPYASVSTSGEYPVVRIERNECSRSGD